jgi:hypothetical protein
VSDEPRRWCRCQIAQHRTPSGIESGQGPEGRAVVGPSPPVTKSCRSRTTTTRRFITAISGTSMTSTLLPVNWPSASMADPSANLANSIPHSGLCCNHSQKPGLGIPCGRHSRHDPALHHAPAESTLHRHHRGKKLVVLVGQKKAVAIAVRNVLGRRRWSKLSGWLKTVGPSPVRSC